MIGALIQGISPVLPPLLITALFLLSLFVSWLTYHYITSIPFWKKWTLISLRAATFFILFVLLINPFWERTNVKVDAPKIAVYLDNSQSIGIERGEYHGLESYRDILSNFNESVSELFHYEYFTFDQSVTIGDEIDATGVHTHLNTVIEHIRENDSEFVASVLISDGVFTQGRDPRFAAQSLSSPLFTIPVGDTTNVRDIAILDVSYNETIYTNTIQTIRAEIQQEGFEGENTAVQFIANGVVSETETINFTTGSSSHIIEFTTEFTEPGFFDFEINIPVKPDEFTDKNNRAAFSVEVLDDKTKILSLAFEIHPDVSAIRNLIATDQQNELISATWIQNNFLTGTDPAALEKKPDLIILHGFPQPDSDPYKWLEQQTVPVLYMVLPATFNRHSPPYPPFEELTHFRVENVQAPLDVHIESVQSEISHPLLEFDSVEFHRLPTLKIFQGRYQVSPWSQVLLRAEFQRVPSNIPLLIASEGSEMRHATVNAFGWYRFKQSRQEETRQFFSQFFTNLISWASTSPDQRILTLEPVKPLFFDNETAVVRGYLLNERGEPEPEGTIELEITQGNSERRQFFRMNHIGNGVYQAELGTYPPGVYRVEAVAQKNSRTIGTAETRITINQSILEFVNTKRDDALLEQLAELTGGFFLNSYEFNRMHTFLIENEYHKTDEAQISELRYIHYYGFWLWAIILLLSLEWILRRTVSLP